jgi:hypothetical protein
VVVQVEDVDLDMVWLFIKTKTCLIYLYINKKNYTGKSSKEKKKETKIYKDIL